MSFSAIINSQIMTTNIKTDTATFGGGCFWCIETIFSKLNGVVNVYSGYSGGIKVNPTYKEVCTGTTGHAEVVQVVYDPLVIGFDDLLEVFFEVHDPTSLNRQGADVGTQYRSVIFYHNENQKKVSQKMIENLNTSDKYSSEIVTEVKPFDTFYKAENYHQDYFENNPNQPYCQLVVSPKVEKFKKKFSKKLQ